ncbi:gas vesicle protein [Streptomyces anulatus]|uniref:gas vesicle protein GvpO n=1 Tax=Streptomyces anulatus TaxID=1892 RepID=UPI00342FC119
MPARRRARGERVVETDASADLYEEDEEAFDEEDAFEDEPREEVSGRGRSRVLSAAAAGKIGLRNIAELTGKEIEGVTLVQPEENGWLVAVEVVEDRRVPSSGDTLAIYEAELDREGGLLSYRRTRRYKRGKGDGGEAS